MLDLILQEENQILTVYTNRVLILFSVDFRLLRTAWIFRHRISWLRSNVQHDGGKFNAVRNRYANQQ